MALRIIKSCEPIVVNRITVCLYSVPGIGKTSTGFTAHKPLTLDFDHGAHRSRNRRDIVPVDKWEDVVSMTAADFAGYSTAVVDTAGRALDILTPKIINDDPKMGRGGALTLPGYGRLKSEFIGWTKTLMSFGLDVILLCHSDESRKGDEVIERLDMQGASKNEVYKSADVMGRLYMLNGKRMLNFSPTDVAFGKNPAGLAPIEVPDFATNPDFFGGVIAQVKAKLNEMSEEQTAAANEQAKWAEKFASAETVEAFNALISDVQSAPENVLKTVKLMLVKAAGDKGFAIPKGEKQFAAKAA